MITLDSLRSAVLSNQPWSELDRLVQAELSSGQLTNQIYDELVGMTEALRETPGFNEQSEEAFGDTLDRLSGFCHVDSAYKNPPTMPTEEEIAKLPRWARVAFAARCAIRVFPLYSAYWPEGRVHQELEARTLRECEESAREAKLQYTKRVAFGTVFQGMHPLSSVASTAVADAFGVLLASGGDPTDVLRTVKNIQTGLATAIDLTAFIRRDFDQLFRSSVSSDWTADSPVPPEVFGPLWPEGPPKGWPVEPNASKHADIALEVVNRDGLDERVIEDEVVNLFNAMNRFHIARGGRPLTLEDLQPLISALVPAGV